MTNDGMPLLTVEITPADTRKRTEAVQVLAGEALLACDRGTWRILMRAAAEIETLAKIREMSPDYDRGHTGW